jgi:hypothetical protein
MKYFKFHQFMKFYEIRFQQGTHTPRAKAFMSSAITLNYFALTQLIWNDFIAKCFIAKCLNGLLVREWGLTIYLYSASCAHQEQTFHWRRWRVQCNLIQCICVNTIWMHCSAKWDLQFHNIKKCIIDVFERLSKMVQQQFCVCARTHTHTHTQAHTHTHKQAHTHTRARAHAPTHIHNHLFRLKWCDAVVWYKRFNPLSNLKSYDSVFANSTVNSEGITYKNMDRIKVFAQVSN